ITMSQTGNRLEEGVGARSQRDARQTLMREALDGLASAPSPDIGPARAGSGRELDSLLCTPLDTGASRRVESQPLRTGDGEAAATLFKALTDDIYGKTDTVSQERKRQFAFVASDNWDSLKRDGEKRPGETSGDDGKQPLGYLVFI